jgi:hypothetical protein
MAEGEGEMSLVEKIVTSVGLLASLAAAGFWLWAYLIEVPDNIDTIVGGLQGRGTWHQAVRLEYLGRSYG